MGARFPNDSLTRLSFRGLTYSASRCCGQMAATVGPTTMPTPLGWPSERVHDGDAGQWRPRRSHPRPDARAHGIIECGPGTPTLPKMDRVRH